MAQITLHNTRDVSATYVSNNFIDYYMTTANGEYVKIYLYLLRCMNSANCCFSLSSIADKFEHTEKDVQRALKYWEKINLIRLEYDADENLSGIYFLDSYAPMNTSPIMANPTPVSAEIVSHNYTPMVPQEKEAVPHHYTPAKPQEKEVIPQEMEVVPQEMEVVPHNYTPVKPQEKEIVPHNYTAMELASFQEKEIVQELLFVTEHYLKRPLTVTDVNIILFWYDQLEFSVNLIEYLVEYCIGKGHTNLRYMDRVAIAWKKDGVTTVERAKSISASFSQVHFAVMRALGISGRNLVPAETAFIDKWSKNYGFTTDIITEACRRTITATHKPSIEYTDGILTNWYKQNVHHLSDIIKLDSDYNNTKKSAALTNRTAAPNKFHNFHQRTYDYEQLEQQLLAGAKTQEAACP